MRSIHLVSCLCNVWEYIASAQNTRFSTKRNLSSQHTSSQSHTSSPPHNQVGEYKHGKSWPVDDNVTIGKVTRNKVFGLETRIIMARKSC